MTTVQRDRLLYNILNNVNSLHVIIGSCFSHRMRVEFLMRPGFFQKTFPCRRTYSLRKRITKENLASILFTLIVLLLHKFIILSICINIAYLLSPMYIPSVRRIPFYLFVQNLHNYRFTISNLCFITIKL